MLQYGARVNGRLQAITESAALSQPGQTYEAHLSTQGIPDETATITQVLQMEQIPDLKVTYVQTNADGSIVVQFKDAGPGQFGFETVMAYFPQILMLAGVVLLAISLFWVVPALQTIPSYVWYFVAGGALVLGLAWLAGAWKLPTGAAAGEVARQRGSLEVQTAATEKELKAKQMDIDRLDRQAERVQKSVKELQEQADKYAKQEQELYERGVKDMQNATTPAQIMAAAAEIDRGGDYTKKAVDKLREARTLASELSVEKQRQVEEDLKNKEAMRKIHEASAKKDEDKQTRELERERKKAETEEQKRRKQKKAQPIRA
jgi:hypothetical protein